MADPERSAPVVESTPEEEFAYLLSEASERLQAGRLEEARSHLERALSLRPGHEQARNLLGLSLFRMGQLEDAASLFNDLVDDNPAEPSLRLNLAMVQLKAGHLTDARTELERVLDLDPTHARAASYMGLVLERLGSFAEAAGWYEQAGQDARARDMRARAGKHSPPRAPEPVAADVPAPPPLEEELAESEVQAAALSAMRAESMKRPLEMPRPIELESADKAKLGFTLEMDKADEVLDADLGPDLDADLDSDLDSDLDGDLDEHAVLGENGPELPGSDAPSRKADLPKPQAAARATAAGGAEPRRSSDPLRGGETGHERFRGPLSLADLVVARRVDEKGAPEPSASLGGLVVFPVGDVAYVRTDLLVSLAGDFEVEPLNRRYRGRRTDSLFGGSHAPMIAVLGEGLSWLDPGDREVTLLKLANEELYLVEAAVLAFSSGLVWENGRLPDEDGRDLDIVHLRGTGAVVVGTKRPLLSLEVRPARPVTLHAERLIGWSGSVVPSRGPLPGLPESASRPPIVRFEGTGQVLGV